MSEERRADRARDELLAFRARTQTGDPETLTDFLRDRGWLAQVIGGTDFQAAVLDSVLAELDRRDAGSGEAAPLGRFGRFELRAVLGRGGMGTVYQAFDTVLEREVAVKRVRPELLDDPGARQRFEIEARALSAVDHPNLCRLYDVGECDGLPFLVMHYERGETLAARIARQRDVSRAGGASATDTRDAILEIALHVEKIARALHHAHGAGLVHRDVKPGNIILRDDGEPVLLDFGLVREEDGDAGLTVTGAAPGTRPYMSPEQIRAERPVDRRTDVYALGVVLYECLALEHPFASAAPHELADRIVTGAAPPIARLNPRVPRDLRIIVETAMRTASDERYQTTTALADDLAAFRHLQPIRARPASLPRRLQRWCQRHPTRAALLALLVVSLAVVSWLWLVSASRLKSFETASLTTLLARLEAVEPTLYPVWGDRERVDAWLEDARALIASTPDAERRRDELRARSADQGPRERDAEVYPRAPELARLRRELAAKSAELSGMRPHSAEAQSQLDTVRQQVAVLSAHIQELEREQGVRRTYDMSGRIDQLRHDVLAQLAADLPEFAAGPYQWVSREAAWSDREVALTRGVHRAEWQRATEAIAADPRYEGLELALQVGLLPLGPDPKSGLWEFWHARSGSRPEPGTGHSRWTIDGETGLVFVLLPPGRVVMGAQAEDPTGPNYWRGLEPPPKTAKPVAAGQQSEPEQPPPKPMLVRPKSWERPVRRVRVPAMLISKYELTQGQWKRLTGGAHPSKYKWGDEHPVEMISWSEATGVLARAFLQLPTEVEWEYACRGRTRTAWWMGDESTALEGLVNFSDRKLREGLSNDWRYRDYDDGYSAHASVGTFPANPFGLHEVHGNVGEWCADAAQDFAKNRWLRGGSYFDLPHETRSASRNHADEDSRHEAWGVRPVRPISP